MMRLLRYGVLALLVMGTIHAARAKDPSAKVDAPAKSRKPLRVFFLSGQSNMVGAGSERYLRQARGGLLTPRSDVYAVKWGHPSGPLRCGFGFREDGYGPELMFGHVLGDALEEEVILVKAAWGGKTLAEKFRPPTAVKKRGGEVGPFYKLMMKRFAQALRHLDKHVPAVATNGYELAGFVWFQGENDACLKQPAWDEYEQNLKDLLHDVRTELGAPKMPVVIIQINKSCWGGDEPDPKTGKFRKGGFFVRKAQQRVADADPCADWALTKDLHQGYHYDAASHLVIGERAGKKMLPLLATKIRDDRKNPAVAKLIKAHVLSDLAPRRPDKPDFATLTKGLFAYFPFDEGKGDTVAGAAVQPVKGKWYHRRKKQTVWQKGIVGSALRFQGSTLLEFAGFKEPLDDKGRIAKLSVSFWFQANTKCGAKRIGKGAGRRAPRDDHNWQFSHEANYAGWDLNHFDIDGPVCFTASFNDVGPRAIYGLATYGDGLKWTHVAATYDGDTGRMSVYVDGKKYPEPPKRKPRKPPAKDKLLDGGYGIVPAAVPLAIGGKMDSPLAFAAYDELCFWSRVLSEEEVGVLYNNGHAIDLPDDAGK